MSAGGDTCDGIAVAADATTSRTFRLHPRHSLARCSRLLWPAVLVTGILAVYLPGPVLTDGHVLVGTDHFMLHARRMSYARQHLFSSEPRLPGWYTREALGTPFWSNIQNFPFTPPRLVLLAFEPHVAYAVGVSLAAVLTGLFTFLYCRRIGLGGAAAAAAGWTMACCGFFASRVRVGHLPLLEAFAALPLLLWLVEVCRARARDGAGRPDACGPRPPPGRGALLALGVAAACVALCGHPQLPLYALLVAFLYAVLHDPRRWRIPAAMALGVGVAAFALLPMLGLIGRSTRVLGLDPPNNNISMPYGRLATFLFPGREGWPKPLERTVSAEEYARHHLLATTFWDTVCYIGWLPLLALAGLLAFGLARLVRRHRAAGAWLPRRPWPFIIVLGVASLLLALPPVHALTSRLPGTFLRSPSRLLYLTSFALALGLAAAVEAVLRYVRHGHLAHGWGREASGSCRTGVALFGPRGAWSLAAWAVLVVALAAHLADLASYARSFLQSTPLPQEIREQTAGLPPGEGRRAVLDLQLWLPVRGTDDVGFFDSIMLARTYRALVAMAGSPPGYNTQLFDGTRLSGPALHVLGVDLIVTERERKDLPPLPGPQDSLHRYAIPNPLPRAAFFGLPAVRVLDHEAIQERFRRIGRDPGSAAALRSTIALPPDAPGAAEPAPAEPTLAPAAGRAPGAVRYSRPSSDLILVDVDAPQAGYVRVLESWDTGWSAMVDGQPAEVAPADDTFLAVRVPPGAHQVRFEYRTPYAAAGVTASLLSAALLAWVALTSRPRPSAGS